MGISARNKQLRPFHLLIVAGGGGVRAGTDIPKQYLDIGGKCILQHTLDAFSALGSMKSVSVVIHTTHQELFQNKVIAGQNINIPYAGDERKDSVFNGLKSLSNLKNDEIILIHDAARPFVSALEIEALLAAMDDYDAATLACPVSDSLRRDDGRGDGAVIDRNGLWAIQTPQAFRYGVICKAHETLDLAQIYTDDTSMVSAMGVEVSLVPAGRQNFKITDAADIELAGLLIRGTQSMGQIRTGTGYDVHAFATEKGDRPLMLCGVDIPHDRALAGHSDADVGLHAITDALLGALGEGDIGDHFPPSDVKWKDRDSAHFLQHAVEMLTARGGSINNLDVTVICEAPKLFSYKKKMKQRVAAVCAINETQVNIKATTTEKLGFTGREEGIAAQAVATITMPSQRAE